VYTAATPSCNGRAHGRAAVYTRVWAVYTGHVYGRDTPVQTPSTRHAHCVLQAVCTVCTRARVHGLHTGHGYMGNADGCVRAMYTAVYTDHVHGRVRAVYTAL